MMSGATRTTSLPTAERLRLAADPTLGVGNFLHRAARANPNRDEPLVWLERPLRALGGETFAALSLAGFERVAREYAAFYHGAGVRPKDPIAVYIDEGVENYVHLVALTSLGAIAVPINSNMKPEVAAEYIRRVGAVGAFLGPAQERALDGLLDRGRLRFVATPARAAEAPRGELPAKYPYEHAADDVVVLCHSSGTTGAPKAVIEQHAQLFAGTRRRLLEHHHGDEERVLSAMPHSHSGGIVFFMISVLSGVPTLLMTDPSARAVLPAIEAFRPTTVVGFNRTFSDLASADLDAHDLGSVGRWLNVADTAHEKHIRRLVARGSRVENGERVAGSVFVDQLGSTEMAFGLFQKRYTKESGDYGRSMGRPHPIAEAAALDEDGTPLGPGRVGRLGVKAPSITPGYWNDSLMTCRSRLAGYWLTGDLVYRDADGNFFHVDRVGDDITTRAGKVYSLPTEEVIMQSHDDVLDCFVVGMRVDDEHAEPVAIAHVRPESALGEDALLALFNGRLRERDLPELARVVAARSAGEWPTGPTGKVVKRWLRDRFDARAARGG
ncbi:MAG TPA: class I adenylate-forming enzyme family protein [Polyangiaceae bacterium]|nr:class I adenylate-forming enzyme family protein [Polyangiaceae bacterium]